MDKREGGDGAAFPGIAPEEGAPPARRLECDGEIFEQRPDGFGGTHYTWLSGPNPGYGFSVSQSLVKPGGVRLFTGCSGAS